MIKTLLSITAFSALMLMGNPLTASATASIEFIDVNTTNIVVTSSRNAVRVTGAYGKTLYIFDLSGKCVKVFKVDGADCRFDLSFLNKGIYLVKVGDVTRKLPIN